MKNISGFAVFVIILCGALGGVQAVFAQEKSKNTYAFSFSYQFGFLYGQAEELVYPADTKAEYLSQLLWDIKPVLYNGLLLDFSPASPAEKSGVFSNISFKYGIPGNSGKMEDRDWVSLQNTALTHFSSHDNITREIFLIDACGGYSLALARFMVIKPFINVSYMRYRFSGTGGYASYAKETSPGSGIYAPIDWSTPHFFEGKVINYTQEWITAAPGFFMGFYFLKLLFTEFSFQISPLIICVDLDEHLKTNVQYRDYMRGGLLIEPAFRLSCAFNRWVELSASCSWRFIKGSKGEIYARNPIGSGTYTQQGIAGAGLSIIDTGFLLKVRL